MPIFYREKILLGSLAIQPAIITCCMVGNQLLSRNSRRGCYRPTTRGSSHRRVRTAAAAAAAAECRLLHGQAKKHGRHHQVCPATCHTRGGHPRRSRVSSRLDGWLVGSYAQHDRLPASDCNRLPCHAARAPPRCRPCCGRCTRAPLRAQPPALVSSLRCLQFRSRGTDPEATPFAARRAVRG